MATPDEKAQAAIEDELTAIDHIVLDGEIDSMESRYQLGEKIRGVVHDARKAERTAWQERERVLREALGNARTTLLILDLRDSATFELCEAALAQTQTETQPEAK